MVPSRTRPLLVSLGLLVALALPSQAHAAVTVSGVQLQPSTTAAGAHPDFAIDTKFTQNPESDDLKSLRVLLPQGLVGDPNAADRCSQSAFGSDACPAGSKVGTAQVTAVITTPLGDSTQTAPGDLYLLDPVGSEVARLGMVVRPQPVAIFAPPKIFLQAGVFLGRDTGYGLSTTFDNIPRSDGGFDLRITETKLTLNGQAARGPFVTNPTACRQAPVAVSATSYDEAGTSTGSASFTPNACDALAFAPKLSGTIGGQGLTKKNGSPTLTSVIEMPRGQANLAAVKITLPKILAPNISQIGRACPQDAFAAGNCPSSARVGSALATSPLLPTPIQGPVLLLQNAQGGPLPQLAIMIGGNVPLTLTGDTGLENSHITNTFGGLPDLPLSKFQLTIDGGQGLITNLLDLCTPGGGSVLEGTMTAQSGKTAPVSGPLTTTGCVAGSSAAAKPRSSMSIRFSGATGVLTAHFRAGRGAPPLTQAQLTLAPGLKGRRKGLAVSEARRLGRKALSIRGRRLTAKLTRKGAVSVAVRWRGIRASRKVASRLSTGAPLKFVALLTDSAGTTTKLRVPVVPKLPRKKRAAR